ncbi:hypothetical protein [Tenggerimyces flavus]|uniref:Secreted protein n=1 Tax=Tenggerimyces flavus TaxID=1708749 RepID=A0ABV7YJ14_9ACTN|nr:hypothetical protein [Tenggerimyces flavus]MBM7784535.1 hypothetical protein [Tenggerimyces flavus]
MKLRKAAALLAATLAPAGLLVGMTATQASAAVDCVVSNPDAYNGWAWTVRAKNGKGNATFYEYDEKLTVRDTDGNGVRTQAQILWCYNGAWRHYGYYDSGPNEGSVDTETYDLNFRDGRKLIMIVREKDGTDASGAYLMIA